MTRSFYNPRAMLIVVGLAAVTCKHSRKPVEQSHAASVSFVSEALGGEQTTKRPRVRRLIAERTIRGACATLAASPKEDPFVAWGKHFPVESRGLLASAPTHVVNAAELAKMIEELGLRNELYDIVDCGSNVLLWLAFGGGCAMLGGDFQTLSDKVGPLELIACFSYIWSEVVPQCDSGEAPLEKCQYLFEPLLHILTSLATGRLQYQTPLLEFDLGKWLVCLALNCFQARRFDAAPHTGSLFSAFSGAGGEWV